MSETTTGSSTPPAAKKRSGSINSMLLADLKAVAGGLGIAGAASMKKAQLIEAIKAHQDNHAAGAPERAAAKVRREAQAKKAPESAKAPASAAPEAAVSVSETPAQEPAASGESEAAGDKPRVRTTQRTRQRPARGATEKAVAQTPEAPEVPEDDRPEQSDQGNKSHQGNKNKQGKQDQNKQDQSKQNRQQDQQGKQNRQQEQNRQQQQDQNRQQQQQQEDDDFDDEGGSRRNRRRRGRERTGGRSGSRNEPDTTILEDDVLVPAAGILDVLDNYAFVRTSGYLPGVDDVYLSLSMVRKYGLRRGDAIVGQVRHPREGERREKFNPMVRIDSVNGVAPEAAQERPEFANFIPIHPAERLRLETDRSNTLGRVIDVAAPIGKGQRGLVVAPPRSGKTEVMGAIASSISANNPECHLMVVLIDERPEEVTDYQRSIRGEVIASTFDRPATDHILIAELAVERAKRLVELGHDVVVLMDSLTSLGRAYSTVVPATGKVLHGGVDSAALHPAKQLFGAARNVEDGGSLTILATAIVETGSSSDDAIFEEFAGTANMELVLRGELAARRLFPPVDVVGSSTRREEHLLGEEEQAILLKLRTALMDVDALPALESVLGRMSRTKNNVEFLAKVQQADVSELAKR